MYEDVSNMTQLEHAFGGLPYMALQSHESLKR